VSCGAFFRAPLIQTRPTARYLWWKATSPAHCAKLLEYFDSERFTTKVMERYWGVEAITQLAEHLTQSFADTSVNAASVTRLKLPPSRVIVAQKPLKQLELVLPLEAHALFPTLADVRGVR
jgi:hypothetical protein